MTLDLGREGVHLLAVVDGVEVLVEYSLGGGDGTIDNLLGVGQITAVGQSQGAEGGGGCAHHWRRDLGVLEELGRPLLDALIQRSVHPFFGWL